MDYRLLGRSGLKVSALSIGTATFGGDGLWGATDVGHAANLRAVKFQGQEEKFTLTILSILFLIVEWKLLYA